MSAFWKGIAIGFFLAFAASVAANLLHNKVIRVLDRGKIVSHQRLKKRADRFYKLIDELHCGKRDKYLYMMTILFSAIVAAIASATMLVCAVVLAPRPSILTFELLPWSADAFYIYIFFLISYFFLLLAFLSLIRFTRIRRALDDFVAFEAEYRKRWGGPST